LQVIVLLFQTGFRKLVDVAVENFGGIDILILNAGISAHVKFEEIEDLGVFH
jgi:NAD(P)-dependent dehydrogenase (short-subunit alcohol dehydrogenase family)